MSADGIATSLRALAGRRPVFHSEANFQHALAWQLQLDHPEAQIRLETRPLSGKPVFLDLILMLGSKRFAVELKYLVTTLEADIGGERFILRKQSAHDVRRYDVVKDLCRLEELVRAGGNIVAGTVGWAERAGAGTTSKRTEVLALTRRYQLRWTDYSSLGGAAGRFRRSSWTSAIDTVTALIAGRRDGG